MYNTTLGQISKTCLDKGHLQSESMERPMSAMSADQDTDQAVDNQINDTMSYAESNEMFLTQLK
jgi:hypothetical protein